MPLLTLVTVSAAPLKVCPLSFVAAVTALNRSTALPFSVKVGLTAVALSEGAALGGMAASKFRLSISSIRLVPEKVKLVMFWKSVLPDKSRCWRFPIEPLGAKGPSVSPELVVSVTLEDEPKMPRS